MNQARTLEILGVGKVLFEPSRRAKRLNLSVRPPRGVRVAVPRRTSFKTAEAFVCSKKRWINKHLKKMQEKEGERQMLSYLAAHIEKTEAKQRLTERLQGLGKLYGLGYDKVFVRDMKSRWGSCSEKNNISLNVKLVVLPPEVLDYVISHELVHTQIKNHSKDFWQQLEGIIENARALDSKLKQYDMMLL